MEERKRKGGVQSFKPTRQGNVKADRDRWENGGREWHRAAEKQGKKRVRSRF